MTRLASDLMPWTCCSRGSSYPPTTKPNTINRCSGLPPTVFEATISVVGEPLVHPIGTRVGNAVIDATIDATLIHDLSAIRSLVSFVDAGCTDNLGIGFPTRCEADQVEGTVVRYFPVLGPSHAEPIFPDAIDQIFDFEVVGLYAVYRVHEDTPEDIYYPGGKYGIVFVPRSVYTQITVLVDETSIVSLDFSGRSPDQVVVQEAEELILPPP